MHDETRVVVRKVGIFPSHIHKTSVVHHPRVPIGILIESHAAQLSRRGLVGDHVADLIRPVYARHALISYVAHGDDAAARHVGAVEELQIGLVDLDGLMQPRAVTAHFIDTPAIVLVDCGEEDAFAVPVQQKIRHRRTVCRFVYRPHIHVAAQVRQLGNLGIEAAACRRRLVRPVVGLRTERGRPRFAGIVTQTVTADQHFGIVKQRIRQQYLPFERYDTLYGIVILWPDIGKKALQLTQLGAVAGGIVVGIGTEIVIGGLDRFDIQILHLGIESHALGLLGCNLPPCRRDKQQARKKQRRFRFHRGMVFSGGCNGLYKVMHKHVL